MEIIFSGSDYPGVPTVQTETVGNIADRNFYAQAALTRLYIAEVDRVIGVPVFFSDGARRGTDAMLIQQGQRWWISVGRRGTTAVNREISISDAVLVSEHGIRIVTDGNGGIEGWGIADSGSPSSR